ncbi:MAG: phage integrase N-terminal SAM-like domain-containing protein [Candidatus Rokubacteria bacterium]|nr:phage integrase N-terminal SAM-like domain-containing protein [Candidatus Rokubacteria bacterium]
MSELRTLMIRDMALRGLYPRTHEAYNDTVVKLAKYYKRSPDQLSNDEVQAYLAHLIQERKLAWSTCSQAAHAFRFLYHVTLAHPRTDVWARSTPRTLRGRPRRRPPCALLPLLPPPVSNPSQSRRGTLPLKTAA